MSRKEVLDSLVEECESDHVGLWEIGKAARLDLGLTDSFETHAASIRLVRELLGRPAMQIGHPTPDGRRFVSWNLSADDAVQRIEKEWKTLGRDPDIGEIAWFTYAPAQAGRT